MFRKLNVKLFYFTAYHSQTNDLFKKINQTMKIALRYHLSELKNISE